MCLPSSLDGKEACSLLKGIYGVSRRQSKAAELRKNKENNNVASKVRRREILYVLELDTKEEHRCSSRTLISFYSYD